MIDPAWYAEMASFLGGFPENYLVFDCETNGLAEHSPQTMPIQLGFCSVRDRVPTDEGAFLINWGLLPGIDMDWFERSVRKTKQGMMERGIDWWITWELIRDQGLDPREVVPPFRQMLEEAQEHGYMYVGHNAYGFDRPIVENATLTATGDAFRFDHRMFIDTGMIEKCHSAGMDIPKPGERPIFRWYEYVRGEVLTGKWNLSLCARKYGLVEKHNLDLSLAHGADFDSRVTHHLLEAYRELADSYGAATVPF